MTPPLAPPLILRCDCGTVELALAARPRPPQGNHVICHCNSCRAFARVLGRGDILDPGDGTAILQVSSDRLEIRRGQDRIAALRLSPGGIYRWYAACCDTPLGNTASRPGWAFFGAITHGVTEPERLGLVAARVNIPKGKTLPGGLPPARGGTLGALLQLMAILAGGALTGRGRRHPLFPGGAPLAEPRLVSREEREAAYGPQP